MLLSADVRIEPMKSVLRFSLVLVPSTTSINRFHIFPYTEPTRVPIIFQFLPYFMFGWTKLSILCHFNKCVGINDPTNYTGS